MISGALDTALNWFTGGGLQTTVIVTLLLAIVYFRKALGLGSVLADWIGRFVFSMAVLLVLLVTGIVPGLNLDVLFSYVESIIELAFRAFEWII